MSPQVVCHIDIQLIFMRLSLGNPMVTYILAPGVHYSRNINNITGTTQKKRREPRPIKCGRWPRGQMSQPHRDMKLPNESSLLAH